MPRLQLSLQRLRKRILAILTRRPHTFGVAIVNRGSIGDRIEIRLIHGQRDEEQREKTDTRPRFFAGMVTLEFGRVHSLLMSCDCAMIGPTGAFCAYLSGQRPLIMGMDVPGIGEVFLP